MDRPLDWFLLFGADQRWTEPAMRRFNGGEDPQKPLQHHIYVKKWKHCDIISEQSDNVQDPDITCFCMRRGEALDVCDGTVRLFECWTSTWWRWRRWRLVLDIFMRRTSNFVHFYQTTKDRFSRSAAIWEISAENNIKHGNQVNVLFTIYCSYSYTNTD